MKTQHSSMIKNQNIYAAFNKNKPVSLFFSRVGWCGAGLVVSPVLNGLGRVGVPGDWRGMEGKHRLLGELQNQVRH